jgi:hypothetical protein
MADPRVPVDQSIDRTTPLSTRIAAPVVAEACSEARYTARLATSSTVVRRRIGEERVAC